MMRSLINRLSGRKLVIDESVDSNKIREITDALKELPAETRVDFTSTFAFMQLKSDRATPAEVIKYLEDNFEDIRDDKYFNRIAHTAYEGKESRRDYFALSRLYINAVIGGVRHVEYDGFSPRVELSFTVNLPEAGARK